MEVLVGIGTGLVLFFGPYLATASFGFWFQNGAALWLPYFLVSTLCYALIAFARYFSRRSTLSLPSLFFSYLLFLIGVFVVELLCALMLAAAF